MVQENHDTVKLNSRVAFRARKTLKKMLDKSCQFLSSEQPSEPKSLDVAFIIARVEKKKRSENLRQSSWSPFDSSVSDGRNLCPLWSVIHKSV